MPIHILVAMLSLLGALVLYSVGSWGSFRAGSMETRHIVLLWAGFLFDVVATSIMALEAGGIQRDLHTVLAFLGMFGIVAVAVTAMLAPERSRARLRRRLSRWVLAPWAVWVVVFVWGMISRGAARIV